ncbi:MAX gene-associated protein [Parambassis ranga]|uniref:MAX gene-associated protein n=1 Tax=Parambassis ranga TaxID=210632 RepID=A0A6P7HNH8_9TELE|nr:MAX gene-associated protein-like [Parambassis ranga]
MSASDSELTSMDDSHAVEDERGGLLDAPSTPPPASIPSSAPPFPTTTGPNSTSEAKIESKAVSVASNDCSSALSSPAEASPAKPAASSTSTLEGAFETSQATSLIASASDSLTSTGTSLNAPFDLPSSMSAFPSATFGNPGLENDFPAVLTFKGISVTLENNSVWKQFYSCGTEMILTKQGRRMFPYCRYRLSGLDPERQYSLVLSIVPLGQNKYRWSTSKWDPSGPAEHQAQGLIRAFPHHISPCKGSEWMNSLLSFYKLKLTNNPQDEDGHIILHSMHRYIPRLHVIPVPDGAVPTADQPVVMGPESITFTFPQTEFMAVTTYQNFRITQLKINHNPFAKGFRDDGNNPRLNRIYTEARPGGKIDTQPSAGPTEKKEVAEEPSARSPSASVSTSKVPENKLVLKPIMSNPAAKDVPCMRGKHALCKLVLVQERPLVEPMEDQTSTMSVTPEAQQGSKVWMLPKARSVTPTSSTSTPRSSPRYCKKRRRINRHWANSRGKEWKAANASPQVVQSPSLTVAMQPELDDVEGLLFMSFTSKEALEVHLRDKLASDLALASPVSPATPTQSKQTLSVEMTPETDEEKIVRFEAIILNDLKLLKYRQVIHPVLKEVGLKLSTLDHTMAIDLQYLGVHLPLPPPNLPDQSNTTVLSPGDEGLPFISRTGKTSDMTKIKGWKNKFIRSKETSPSNCEGLQKNLSAFCSNMLDEYLESEAQQITERAAAFSTNPEGSVAYQLPSKSSSYVKTLDSVLKHRNNIAKAPVPANRPCPLSYKSLLYSALASPAPPLASATTSSPADAQFRHQSAASSHSSAVSASSDAPQRIPPSHPGVSQRPEQSFSQSQGMKPTNFPKFQVKLMKMEAGAVEQGLDRTQLTLDRLSVALSVILTKKMLHSQIMRVPAVPNNKAAGPECGQEFCRLGCVCSSLQQLSRQPLHCRRPECMFGCDCCHSQEMTKENNVTNEGPAVHARVGYHANKLWIRNIHDLDSEPLLAPICAPLHVAPPKVPKRSSAPHPTYQIREEDKDPVYKYLESMMTCARVREFNSKPPPEVTIEPKILPTPSTINTTTNLQKTTQKLPIKVHNPTTTANKAEKTPQETTSSDPQDKTKTTSSDPQAKTKIEIQSGCQWKKDHKMVLEALCQRLKENRLTRRFYVGPYCVSPVARIFMRKSSGSTITYRVLINKPLKCSDNDEDECDDSDEEKDATKSCDRNADEGEEEDQTELPRMQFGITPFLSGVLPAGRLRARRKPAGCQASGLIQVNGKCYNQARLLLGNMGSLHPANRLAAHVTGRLNVPGESSDKNLQKASEAAVKPNIIGSLHFKAAGGGDPTTKKTDDVNTPAQPTVQFFQPFSWRSRTITSPQLSQNSTVDNQSFFSRQSSSASSVLNSSTSSPVVLTVSPSLKSPSFLGQSGTYSFRICPPSNQGTKDQKLPGVSLPGGFMLIHLPKPGEGGAAQQSAPLNMTSEASRADATIRKDGMLTFSRLAAEWLGVDSLKDARSLKRNKPAEPGTAPELSCHMKIPSDESDETSSRQQVDSNLDIASEDLSSMSSDYSGEELDDDELLDIETVEERQAMAIAKMRASVLRDDSGSPRDLSVQEQLDDEDNDSKDNVRRKNHTELERLRRTEQKVRFDKLQKLLQCDIRTPRLRVLSVARREIQNLAKTSKCLEEKKQILTRMQSVYVERLCLLSGKSEKQIRNKLKEIYEKQKSREKTMKWTPFFSQLLQSRAALLQASAPPEPPPAPPLLSSLILPEYKAPSQTDIPMIPAQRNIHHILSQLKPLLEKALKSDNTPKASGAPDQATISTSQKHIQPQAPTDTATLQPTAAQSPQTLSLPLIRTKNGRLILPSSLKPAVPGFYTLMVMQSKQKGEEGEVSSSATVQPSDVDSKNKETAPSASEQPSHSETRCISDDKTNPSDSDLKRSKAMSPLAEIAVLNRSISLRSSEAKTREEPESNKEPGLTPAVPVTSLSVESGSHPSPDVVIRRRGRPRKHPIPQTVEKQGSETSKSMVGEERQGERNTVEQTQTKAEAPLRRVSREGDNPVPVKRGRGRPPKNKSAQPKSPTKRKARSSSISDDDSPARFACSVRSPAASHVGDAGSSRPLTRASLGKDFPSAKKRSWIDVEKELEPDVESD